MSKMRPANLIPADAGAGAAMSIAVRSPGCVTSAKDTTTGCSTFWASVATTGCCRTSTRPPTGAVTLTDETALPTLPLESLNWKLTFVVPTGNNVSAVTSVREPSIVARERPRRGAASRMSTVEPPARNALKVCDASDAGTLARAPPACVAATVIGAGGVTTGGAGDRGGPEREHGSAGWLARRGHHAVDGVSRSRGEAERRAVRRCGLDGRIRRRGDYRWGRVLHRQGERGRSGIASRIGSRACHRRSRQREHRPACWRA